MSAPSGLPRSRSGAILSFVGVSVAAGVLLTLGVTPAIALTGMAANNSISLFEDLPSYIKIGSLPERTTVYAHRTIDGADVNIPITSFYAEDRDVVAWDQVSQFAKDAAVAGEDPRYYEHGGVDPLGVVRAALSNIMGGDVQGASTITQQYVKNVQVAQATALASPEEQEAAYEAATAVSLDRKLKEMRLAIALEKETSKDDILLGYLNIALFGGRVYGIQSAAQHYYSVNAADLTLAQAASLIAIVNNPEKFRLDQPEDPDNGAANGYAANLERRDYVLDKMLEYKDITQQQHDEAIATPITPVISNPPSGCQAAGNAAFFCDYVTNVIKNDPVFGDNAEARYAAFLRGGLQVYTTLDLDMQDVAQGAIDAEVPKYMDGVDIASAATAVEAGTGKIKAMAENKDYNQDADAAAQGPNFSAINYNTDVDYGGSQGFQAASTYKAFTLIAWLQAGHSLYDTVNVSEKPWDLSTFRACDQSFAGTATFENDENERGSRTIMQSTARSVNGGFIAMGQQLDQCDIRNAATSLLVHPAGGGELSDYPGDILGAASVSPLTMATAYAGIANDGYVCSPIAIERIVNQDGSDAAIPQSTCTQGIAPDVAQAAQYALRGVIEGGTATASNPDDGIEHIAKTGTSDFNVQTWTTGASKKIGLSVLVGQATGDADLRKTYLENGTAATARHRIWEPIMAAFDERFGGDDFTDPSRVFLYGQQIDVPDVIGLTLEQAKKIIESADLTFADGGAQPSEQEAGTVISTSPGGGGTTSRGGTVTVYTSDGTKPGATTMPDVTGQVSNAAVTQLTAAGFAAANITYAYSKDGFVAAGSKANGCKVKSSDPAPGAATNVSASIVLTLFSATGTAPTPACS